MILTLGWLPVDAEADLSPPGSDDSKPAPGTKPRQIRLGDMLWDNAEIVAHVLRTERSVLVREFLRWMTFEPGATMPTRPDVEPEGLAREIAFPAAIKQVTEGSASGSSRTRWVVYVDAKSPAVLDVLKAAKIARGLVYMSSAPMVVSAPDQARALEVYKTLKAAGMRIVNDL